MDEIPKPDLPIDPMWYQVRPDDSEDLKREKCRRFQELTIEQRFRWNDHVCQRMLAENPNLLKEIENKQWWPGAKVQILELPKKPDKE